jgi:glycogen debranching enzyme
MSASQQTIIDLQAELETLADSIYNDSINLSETAAAIEEANDEIETRRAAFMSQIFNERYEINNKLKYTNEDQRKVRLREIENADVDFQALKSARSTLAATSAAQKAEIEKNRNLHKTQLLVLQYYANLT